MRVKLLAVVLLAFSTESEAHHSPAQFDLSATVIFDAIVTEFEWKNPHVFIQVDRADDDGEVTALQIEADGVSMLLPHSWSRDSLGPGDRVRVEGLSTTEYWQSFTIGLIPKAAVRSPPRAQYVVGQLRTAALGMSLIVT